jgi:hypothetical protein
MTIQRARFLRHLPIIAVTAVFAIFLSGGTQMGPGAGQATPEKDHRTVLRGGEPTEVLAIVSAMTQEPYFSEHILIIEVLKVLNGKNPGHYLRADFPNRTVMMDSDDARAYQRLASALRLQRIWMIHLRPPRGPNTTECAWRVPPPLKPGEVAAFEPPPIFRPVGDSSVYPDINTLTCYVFEQKDVQEAQPSNF